MRRARAIAIACVRARAVARVKIVCKSEILGARERARVKEKS